MKGTIIKIHPIKYSRNGQHVFTRVEFKLEDNTWAKTDLVQGYRNYPRWENLLKVGNDLNGLVLKKKGEVDADSYPEIFKNKIKSKWSQLPNGTMELVIENKPEEIKPLEPLEKDLIQLKLI